MMNRARAGSLVVASVIGFVLAAAFVGCNRSESKSQDPIAPSAKAQVKRTAASQLGGTGKGMAALREASQANKYLFAYFFKAEDETTLARRKVFDRTMEELTERAHSVAVNIADASEESIVAKFDLARAPMPLVLAVAPNGAITGGFPATFDQRQLLEALVGPATQKVIKSLQEGKLVLVCAQNESTKSNQAAMHGVNEFAADERFAQAAEIVLLDPADKKEAAFLADLQVAPEITEATTVFLAPPGRPVAKYEGATEKQALVDALGKANACGPGGCGPGGCGPGGCGPAK